MARILVVDDQSVILKMLETLLKAKGHIVTCSMDAFDALEKVAAESFELVITDAIMPGGASGFDLVKTIRKNPNLANLPVIFLTGRREKKDVARGIEAGADDYVIKPVDPDILLAKVDSLLKKVNKAGKDLFVESTLSKPAQLKLDLQIVGVSEVGMSLASAQPLHPNSKITLQSSFFSEVGMTEPVLRVESCIPNGESGYTIRIQFVGLTEMSLQPLRVWIRSRSLSRAG